MTIQDTTRSPKTKEAKKNEKIAATKTPLWLQTIMAIVKPTSYLEKARSRYGDIFKTRLAGFPPLVVFSNPLAIEQVFAANPDWFDASSSNEILLPLVGDRSLLLLDGAAHKQQRKLLMPPFHGERMRAYGRTICETAELVSGQWSKNKPFIMQAATQEITLRVILRAVFGVEDSSRFNQMREVLGTILDTFNSAFGSSLLFVKFFQKDLGSWSPWGKFLRRKQEIDDLIFAEIRDRQNKPPGEDILSLMMAARDEKGEAMTEIELRDELMTLLFAGHETTASALAWAFYWIHRYPEVRERLLEELNGLDPEADPSAIANLPYLSAVCSETLRIYPVVIFAFGRLLKVPIEIIGYYFEAGTVLAPCIHLVHHREDLYPNPKQFRPERFLERQFSPYEYFPFGGSNRRCLGYAFALFEMKLVLATVLRQVKLELLEERPVRPKRRGVVFRPSTGVRMMAVN